MNEPNIGTVVTVIGPVVDIRFKAGQLPNLLNAIEVMNNGQKLTLEVAQHVGDDIVRCIAMSSTDGLMRGVDAVDTGAPISVPVGNETLGRIFNLLGEAVDNKPTPVTEERWPIHRPRRLPWRSRVEPPRSWRPWHQGHRPDLPLCQRR